MTKDPANRPLLLTRRTLFGGTLALLPLVASCAGQETLQEAPQTFGSPPLAPGDRIRVLVYGQDLLTTEADLDNAGSINIPLIGRVELTGEPPSEAEKTIAARLAKGIVLDPKVSVTVVRYRPIYVLGEVTKPGAYDYTPSLTILDAVALAGGFSRRARPARITVRRRQDAGGQPLLAQPTTRLLPGDVVEVPERWF